MASHALNNELVEALAEFGVPTQLCERVRDQLGTWRSSGAPAPSNVAAAIRGLALNGFPHLAGEPMVFPFKISVPATGTSITLALSPRKPVWAVGMVSTDPATVATIVAEEWKYAGNDIYPDAGKDEVGFVRTMDPAIFDLEALRSDANPWPMGMLLNDELSLDIQVGQPGGAVIEWEGYVLAMSLDSTHSDYRRLLDQTKARLK